MVGQVYYFETIGDVSFVKNSRAKSLRITVKPNDKVNVTIPRFVSLSNAFRFVEEKQDWIKKSLEKMKSIERKSTVFKPGVEFATKAHVLEFHHLPESKLTAKVGNGLIRIFYAIEEQLLTAEAQAFIIKAIEHTLRKEAKAYLPVRTKFLAEKYGFKFFGVCVKNLRSRWGSCSTVNNINLNIHMMRLPDHLVDYVILHELIHTVHKNHGKQFWQALDNVSGGKARLLAGEMKKYRTQVY
jgi:predicted metal-dependent hydrolase